MLGKDKLKGEAVQIIIGLVLLMLGLIIFFFGDRAIGRDNIFDKIRYKIFSKDYMRKQMKIFVKLIGLVLIVLGILDLIGILG